MDIRYFNIAAAGQCPAETIHVVHQHLLRESQLGPQRAFAAAAPVLDKLRSDTAELLGADPSEVAFCPSASVAFGLIFAAIKPLQPGERILVGRHEWGGNLANYRRAAERAGAIVEIIPCDPNGRVDAAALATLIDERVRLISLTWLPANGGLINDAAAIGRIARSAQIPYLIDAAQALGQLPVDVRELGCDVLFGPGRKHLRGPRGSGILFVRRDFLEALDPAWLDCTSAPWQSDRFVPLADARRFDMSESLVALLCGFGRSVEQALEESVANRFARTSRAAQLLRAELSDVREVIMLDPVEGPLSGLVSFNLQGHSAQQVTLDLASRHIVVTAHPLAYTPLDMQARGLDSLVRASVSSVTTDADIGSLLDALKAISARGGLR